MRNSAFVLNVCLCASVVVVAGAGDAHAYVDPGTGSYFLQLLLAGLLGAAFAVRLYWKRVKTFINSAVRRRKKARGDDRCSEDE